MDDFGGQVTEDVERWGGRIKHGRAVLMDIMVNDPDTKPPVTSCPSWL